MTKAETYDELFICTNNGNIVLFRDVQDNPDRVECRKCRVAGNGWIIPVLMMIDFYKIKKVEISGPANADIVGHCRKKGITISKFVQHGAKYKH